jgi:hypothetical protein
MNATYLIVANDAPLSPRALRAARRAAAADARNASSPVGSAVCSGSGSAPASDSCASESNLPSFVPANAVAEPLSQAQIEDLSTVKYGRKYFCEWSHFSSWTII